MKKTTLLILGLLFFIFVNFSFAAIMPFKWDKPKSPEELGDQTQTISNIKGKVKIIQPDGTWKEVSSGSKIQEGDQIRTESGSAIINFSDGNSIELGPHSLLSAYGVEFNLELLFGKIRVKIQHWRKKFEIRTPTSILAVRGTELIVEHSAETNITKVYLYEGIVDVSNLKKETMRLQPGDTVTVDIDGKMVLGKLDQEKWNQLTNEISLIEIPEQTVQPSATKQETTVQPLTKTLVWFGLIVILLCVIGAGVFIYRKKS